MTFFTPHLPFPSLPSSSSSSSEPGPSFLGLPGSSTHLVVSDTLAAPAFFVVHHLVLAAAQARCPRIGSTIPSSFIHISPTTLPTTPSPPPSTSPNIAHPSPSLTPIFDAIDTVLSAAPPPGPSSPPVLVVLDGLSELRWTGFESTEVVRLVRAVFARVRASNGALVSTLHADGLPLADSESTTYGPDEDLLHRLIRTADGWWRVSGLASGRSAEVSGEISCHLGPGSIPRSTPLQYRLEPSAVKVFAKGTGRGYL